MKNILIICHDAGGAEVVSSWANHNPENKYTFILQGPAKNIFYRKKIGKPNYTSKHLNQLISKSDFVLTGTSWGSNLEKRAIKNAKINRVKVASFLEHWCYYPERFQIDVETILPDEIWVGDEYAIEIAKEHFPSEKIKFVSNPYFEDIKYEIEKIKINNKIDDTLRILYVSDVQQEFSIKNYGHPHYFGYNEYEAMDDFLKKIVKKKLKKYKIRIRLHPSDVTGKYKHIIHNHPELPLKESKTLSLIKDCIWADWIVGQESMAQVVGLITGKKVFSSIPNGGKKNNFPFKNKILEF